MAGFDERDYERLVHFIASVRDAGCQVAIVHARKAVLGGLSPKDNREIPPLRYEVVRRLRLEFPTLPLVVNGGLRDAGAVQEALEWCDGVMLGREAYHRPYLLAELSQALYPGAATCRPARRCWSVWNTMRPANSRPVAGWRRLRAICSGFMQGSPARATTDVRSARERAQAGAGPELLRRVMPTEVLRQSAL